MDARIFTLKFNQLTFSFDDTEMRTFTADKEVHEIKDHAFTYQGMPYLALVVTYNNSHNINESSVPTGKNHANTRDESWRKILNEGEVPLFNTLREWRSAKSKEEGVPIYFVCTNKQLADVVHLRPESMTALGKVDGFGEGRLRKYGQEILAILGKKVAAVSQPVDNNGRTVPDSGPAQGGTPEQNSERTVPISEPASAGTSA